jgi:hypothetical protein
MKKHLIIFLIVLASAFLIVPLFKKETPQKAPPNWQVSAKVSKDKIYNIPREN